MNYNDERIVKLQNEKNEALNQSNNVYNDLINQNKTLTEQQNAYMNEWKTTQDALVNKQTEFNVNELERKKEEAEKDYQKEAKASNVEYQKFINPTGVQAEYQASKGLNNTGYSESTKVNAWNTTQNRIATARDSLNRTKVEFDSQITQARLKGDAQLAENALKVLETKMENSLREFETYSTLKQNLLQNNQTIDNTYYDRYQDVFAQQNWEAEQAEARRQWEAEMAYQKERDRIADEQWQKEYALSVATAKKSSSRSSGGSSYSLSGSNYAVNTAYYQGNLNPDANTYGTFSNGYQPKGISGHGNLSKTGDTVTFNTQTLGGQGQTVTQNLWKADDGTKWYWDGRYNKYIQKK